MRIHNTVNQLEIALTLSLKNKFALSKCVVLKTQKTVLENASVPEAKKHLLRCVVRKKNYSRHLDEQCVFHSRLQIEALGAYIFTHLPNLLFGLYLNLLFKFS